MIDLKVKRRKVRNQPSYRCFIVVLSSLLLITLLFGPSVTDAVSILDGYEGYEDPPDDIPGPIDPTIPDPSNLSKRIGGFIEDNVGSFVSSDIIEDGIANHTHNRYTEENITLFSSIRVENLVIYEQNPENHHYRIKGDRADFQVYDKPSAEMNIDVKPLEVLDEDQLISFEIGEENAHVTPIGTEGVKIDYGEFTAILMPYGPMEGERDIVKRNGKPSQVDFTVAKETSFIFRIQEERIYDDLDINEILLQGIKEKRLGAKIRVEAMNEGYHQMSVIYDEISLLGQVLDKGRFQMMVSSDTLGEEGKIVLADISSTVMDVSSFDNLKVTFDGESIPEVDSYSELTDRSNEPTYLILSGDEGVKVFVNVPHFSTHTIIIEDWIDITDTDLEETYLGDLFYYIPGVVFSAAVVSIGAIYKRYRACPSIF